MSNTITCTVAAVLVVCGLTGPSYGQGYGSDPSRRNDPTSPGGRPLAEATSKAAELNRTYEQLSKEGKENDAKEAELTKKMTELVNRGNYLLAQKKANARRLEIAAVQIDLARGLGTGGNYSELYAAERERSELKKMTDQWEREYQVVSGAARELKARKEQYPRRVDAFYGDVVQQTRSPAGSPDSFREIERRAAGLANTTRSRKGSPDSFGEIEKRAAEINRAIR
jgi:hypothetical protein